MAATTTRIIRKTATWLINNQRNYIIISAPTTLLSKKNIIIRNLSTPILNSFSSFSSKQGHGDNHHKVVKMPSEFPFKIENKLGEQTITLTRKYRDVDIEVIVHMPTVQSSTVEERNDELDDQNQDQHKDSVSDPQCSIRLVVSSTSSHGTTSEYGVIAYPDDFLIDSFCIKYPNAPEENIYYIGPDYAKLDKNLQKEFKRRLKVRGITPSTTNFLHEYMANRDMNSSDYSPNSPTTTDQSTLESTETTLLDGHIINDEGISVHGAIEVYRQRGHPLVSAEDIRKSGKKHTDFIWIPYPYTRSEKILWIEVPSKGFYASQSEIEDELERNEFMNDTNPYRQLPLKGFGDPPIFSEELDKILYPDLKHLTGPAQLWEECSAALKAHNDEMNKIKYPNGRPVFKFEDDSDLEYHQVYCMRNGERTCMHQSHGG